MATLRYLLTIGTIVLALTACKGDKKDAEAGGNKKAGAGKPSVFDAVVTEQVPLDRSVDAPGTILPNESTDIRPEISGRVVAIPFKEGSFVEKGSLLVKLFDEDLQAQLRKLEVQLKIAETTEKRQQELLAINGTSQQDLDNAVLITANIKADMDLLKVNIGRTAIRAPFSGRLGLRNISVGAYVTPQNILTNIAQVNSIKAEFSVPERYTPQMTIGSTVTLQADGNPRAYKATVIASQNTVAVDTRSLTVRALVQNPDKNLTPGAFVQVTVGVSKSSAAIMVPTQAIIPTTRFKKVIVSRDGKAAFQNVNTGYRDSARVEILDGLKVGDTILTSGLLSIKEGQQVKVKVGKQ